MRILNKLKRVFINYVYDNNNIYIHNFTGNLLLKKQQKKLDKKSKLYQRSTQSKNIFRFEVHESLPALSWLCEVSDKNTFFCGPSISVSGNHIVEGVWDSDYSDFNFHKTEFMFGSGARVDNDEVTFVPPKHCAECLFVLVDKKNTKTYVSNSMCFTLEKAEINDNSFLSQLEESLENSRENSLSLGIDRYEPLITENENYLFYRLVFYNFQVNKYGHIKLQKLPAKKYFQDFASYKDFIFSKTKDLLDNAIDKNRENKYEPITSISKGYDSPAAAVIGKNAGCKDAVTLDVNVWSIDDCGLDIGKKLEMNIESFSHILDDVIPSLHMELPDKVKNIVLEFIATVGCGDDITFYPFKSSFNQRTFLSGVYGDFVWEKETELTSGLPKRGVFGKSTNEFRLNSNYFHIPMASLGARFAGPIRKLSKSREMEPFSIGGNYDRPIPRRICEEAGLDRKDFGQEKCATSPFFVDHRKYFKEAIATIRKRYKIRQKGQA